MAISSAIVPYKANSSTAVVKPQQSLSGIIPAKKDESAIVPIKKETAKKAEVTTRDIRASVLRLLRKRQQRDRLEAKFYKLQDTLAEREKASKEEAKGEKNSFLSKVGSGFKNQAKKVGGDLFGSIGKLLGFLALDWISKPENQKLVAGIVEGIGHIFKFVEWFVTGSVDNLLSGFNSLIAGDTILERVLGFFQMAAGFMGIRYFLKPQLIVTDLMKLRKFIMDGGMRKLSIFNKKLQKFGLKKALKFAFPKLSKLLSRFTGIGGRILTKIKDKLGIGKVGNLFGKITNALLRKIPALGAAKKAIFHVLKPVTKFLTSIPFVGGLISFGVNMLLGDPPGKAGIKAIGSGLGSWLGAGLGSLLLPGVGTFIGGFLGGLVGDWLGSRFYDLLKGKTAKEPTQLEKERQKAVMARAEMKKAGTDLSDADLAEIAQKMGNNPATGKPYTKEEVNALLSDKPEDTVTTTTTTTTTGDTSGADISLTNTEYVKLMIETMDKGGISDRNERVMFMAQVGHESGDGRYMKEIWGPSKAQAGYEGRSDLGNTQRGDGKKFMGRGYIQITGRANYAKYGPMIGVPDATENPEKLEEPQNAAKVALAYWKDRVNREAARKGLDGMNTVTRNINGGLNGLDDRIAKFDKYSKMPLKGEGDSKPRKSPIPNSVHSISSVPRQQPTRSNAMKQLSMNVVYSNTMKSRGMRKGGTIIIHKAGSANITHESTHVPRRLNSNKPQTTRRGL